MSEPLPRGWTVATISDVVADRVDQAPPAKGVGVTYIDISSIDNDHKRVDAPSRIDAASAPTRARQWVEPGDVLVSMTRPNLNAVAIVPPQHAGAVASTGFDVLRTATIEAKWLYFAVQTTAFIDAMCERIQGVVYPAVRPRDVRAFVVPLPPLPEQRRIVETLETHFTRLDAAVATLDRVRANLKRYRAAVLQAAVEGRLVEGVGTPLPTRAVTTALGDLAVSITQGWSPQCWATPAAGHGSWGVIKTTAVHSCEFDDAENKALPDALPARPDLELREGDFLVTRKGPRWRVGVSCLVRATRPRLLLCDTVYRLSIDTNRADPRYVEVAMNAPSTLDYLDRFKSGINDNGVNLKQASLLSARFPLPSLPQQSATANEVDCLLSGVAWQERELSLCNARLVRLRQSLLRVAFDGRLVPQDPRDEPASLLLDRIRTERAASSSSKKTSPRSRR